MTESKTDTDQKVMDELANEITRLKDELERKNEALEGLMTENEALKDELGGRPKRAAAVSRKNNDLQTRIEQWRRNLTR